MAHRVIKTPSQREGLFSVLSNVDLPFTISWTKGHDRTAAQNRLQWQWAGECARDLDVDDAAGYQAIFKLEIGVPILRAENEEFRHIYDTLIKPASYEEKIKAMRSGMIDVSSRMTKKQMTNYLDRIWAEYTGLGVDLTLPDPEMVGRLKAQGND